MKEKKNNEEKLKSMIFRVWALMSLLPALMIGIVALMAKFHFTTGPLSTFFFTIAILVIGICHVLFHTYNFAPGEFVAICNFLTKDNKGEIILNKLKGAPKAYCKRLMFEFRKMKSTPVRSKELQLAPPETIESKEGSLKTQPDSSVHSNSGAKKH